MAATSATPSERLHFVQWLRVFLTSLVIAHHAGQPYGPTGGEWPVSDPANTGILGAFFGINAAFFMGFFFLISGYFTEASFDRKGPAAFLKARLVRLGIPLLVFTGILFPITVYAFSQPPKSFSAFLIQDYFGRLDLEFGPLWFVAHLLLYAVLYAAWRLVAPAPRPDHGPPPLGLGVILGYALALALVSVFVRTIYPQDAWVRLFWLIPAEPAHLPQYASLFVIGIVAARVRWFTELPGRTASAVFLIGLAALFLAGLFDYGVLPLPGFLDMNLIWGFFEAFVCVGMILGLLALFRRFLDRPGPWLTRLEGNVYGAYLIHVFIVVALQISIVDLALTALAKFAIVSAAAIVISFALTAALRRIPPVRAVI
ncbi:acyltransferase [Ostreiculturibacter nitratireducens]|uniref:acyltransferase n=1 Tax=Ostreiculturibacter nitratireducens TaxID=3075226 RepID=UPI0031B64094